MNRLKKLAAELLCVGLCLSLAACGSRTQTPPESTPGVSPEPAAGSQTEAVPIAPEENSPDAELMESAEAKSDPPVVYMTKDITPESLVAIYEALGRPATGNTAVTISTGEPGSHYLDADLIKDLVQLVDGTIVECNTAYNGSRASTAYHMQLAADHGYTAIADVDIMDADGSVSLPVEGGAWLTENLVGASYPDYDFFIILSHFKGHRMGGFGGAVKNMSVGIASSSGKCLIHSAGASTTERLLDTTPQDAFLEAMAESAKSVADDRGESILYINVMTDLSVDCDCIAYGAPPSMEDIGILASLDPVALDQACVDLIYAAPDGAELIERMESRHAIHALEHAEAIGFGSREYQLVNIDEADEPRPAEDTENKILVAYFSWAENAVQDDVDAMASASVTAPGNVAQLAAWISGQTGGELFSIRVEEPYPAEWDACLSRANQEKADGARPALSAKVENIEDYDTVFLGYPNWWYSCPMAILSFLEENDLSGKQVYLFCSHGTGGLASSVKDITAAMPDSAVVSDNVFHLYEDDTASGRGDVESWLRKIGY